VVSGGDDGGGLESVGGMVEAPASADGSLDWDFKALARAIRLEGSITDAAPDKPSSKG